ncbi:MAG: UPF0175 family protein [Candidatus Methanoperedens sp.]|nr:UPF0175 family protein [Candidatus Methanoperedens sp.]
MLREYDEKEMAVGLYRQEKVSLAKAAEIAGVSITRMKEILIETLLQLRAALAPEISEESCVIVGLFHDIGKVGMPGKPYYLPEVKNGMPTGAYTINPEIVAMGLSLRSLYLVSQYIPLSDAEAQAIAYHDQ